MSTKTAGLTARGGGGAARQPDSGSGAKVRRNADAAYMFDRATETMPREELLALQLRRLRESYTNAYENVALHRERMKAIGFHPQDLKQLGDLADLPFTVKTDLRDHYPFGMFARPRDELLRLHASSGTTGKPTVVGYTAGDLDRWADLMARSLACAGARPGDIIHNAYGYGLFTGGLGAHDGATRLGATVVPMSGGNTEKQIVLLRDFGARVICCTPSYALAIAELAESEGIDLRNGPLAIGVFGAEPWSEAMRREIEARLGLRATDIYGLSEIMGPGVACECEQGQAGPHGWEDHFLFEVIDPETERPVADGESGELVISTLTKEALPMLRYRTRDITRLATATCACGRTHARIQRITGRSDDMLIIRGVNLYPSQAEAALLGIPELEPHYQLVVERIKHLDELTIEVEVRQSVAFSPETFAAIGERVRHHVKSMIGVTAKIHLMPAGSVPRSMGKAVRVRDLRPKD